MRRGLQYVNHAPSNLARSAYFSTNTSADHYHSASRLDGQAAHDRAATLQTLYPYIECAWVCVRVRDSERLTKITNFDDRSFFDEYKFGKFHTKEIKVQEQRHFDCQNLEGGNYCERP